MKFTFLNGGLDSDIKQNFSSKIGKYLIFNRNGWFIGKLVEATTPEDWKDCRFMFEDVHHLKGDFIAIASSIENLQNNHTGYIFIAPTDKKWEEVVSEKLTQENDIIAVKVLEEIAYNELIESMFIKTHKEGSARVDLDEVDLDKIVNRLNAIYKAEIKFI